MAKLMHRVIYSDLGSLLNLVNIAETSYDIIIHTHLKDYCGDTGILDTPEWFILLEKTFVTEEKSSWKNMPG